MTQQTNTKNIGDNNNRNPNLGRDRGRGWGGFDGHGGCRDCGNKISIAKLLFGEKLKARCLHKITITESSH